MTGPGFGSLSPVGGPPLDPPDDGYDDGEYDPEPEVFREVGSE